MKKYKYLFSIAGNQLEPTANAIIISHLQNDGDMDDLKELCEKIIENIDKKPWLEDDDGSED